MNNFLKIYTSLTKQKVLLIPILWSIIIFLILLLVLEIASVHHTTFENKTILVLKKIKAPNTNKITRSNFLDLSLTAHGLNNKEKQVYVKKIDHILNNIHEKISNKELSDKQKAEVVFNYLQENIIESTLFEEKYKLTYLLDNGYGNCLSAVSLYTIILNKLNIDYQLYSLSDHVYLMVDDIDIELTDSDNGFNKQSRKGLQILTKKKIDESCLLASFYAWAATEANNVMNHKLAIKLCNIAKEIYPDLPSAYSIKGSAYRKLGDRSKISFWKYKKAEENYRKAIKICPESIKSHIVLGGFLFKNGRIDEAKKEMTTAYELAKIQGVSYLNSEFKKCKTNLGLDFEPIINSDE